jgi:hypothetical protein
MDAAPPAVHVIRATRAGLGAELVRAFLSSTGPLSPHDLAGDDFHRGSMLELAQLFGHVAHVG